MLQPLFSSVLFTFLDDTAHGRFIDRNKIGLIMTNQDISTQGGLARWGRVLAIGPDVEEESIKPGALVLIEPLQWTMGFKYEGVQIWSTIEEKIIATTDDITDTYQ